MKTIFEYMTTIKFLQKLKILFCRYLIIFILVQIEYFIETIIVINNVNYS